MLYINDPQAKPMTYRELVNVVVESGVQPQRCYIYLASLGIKGADTRQLLSDQVTYGKPQKLAIKDDGTFVMRADLCSECGALRVS